MASVYTRKDSPYFQLRVKVGGKWRSLPTDIQIGSIANRRKAERLAADYSVKETQGESSFYGNYFTRWVEPYLAAKYATSPKTLERYMQMWNALRAFFRFKSIHEPREVKREFVFEYVKWRQNPPKDCGVYACSYNNALKEIVLLNILMNEAKLRDYISENPCLKHGMKRHKSKEKPEMSDNEIQIIRQHLKKYPEWMSIAFEIAIHQGCRLSETHLPMEDVDLLNKKITFTIKGNKRFTTAIVPDLLPLLKKLKKERRTMTYERPKYLIGKPWWAFFRSVGLSHLCFHCTRVTVITRLARARIPMSEVMNFVGHSSELVHRVYQRLNVDDVRAAASAVKIPSYNP
ncbi:MAG: tyrosine-type recombinase/integrase [Verrucomicrobiia bacterium]